MTFSLLPYALRGLLLLLHTAGVLLALYLVLRYLQLGRNRRLVLSLALYFALHAFLLALLTQEHLGGRPLLMPVPLWLHLLIPLADLAFGSAQLYLILRWREECITTDSVLESFDALNEGLCFYDTVGMPKLVNPRMQEIIRSLTKKEPADIAEFFDTLKKGGLPGCITPGDAPLYQLRDGHVFSFRSYPLKIRGQQFQELVASDVTEEYALTRSLEEKNKQARILSVRLNALMKTMEYLVMDRELVKMKVTLHDHLGRALLLSKRYLCVPGSVTEEELLQFWDTNIRVLKNEEPEFWQQPYYVSLEHAAALGVKVDLVGSLPEEDRLISLISPAITAHVTNTLRHAEGTRARIVTQETEDGWTLTFTNDGKTPVGPIREGGGLSNLRRSIESQGGRMQITSHPVFQMTLYLPKEAPHVIPHLDR